MLRIDGIASGLDTGDMIKQLMSVERRPITLIKQRQDRLSAQKGHWSNISTILEDLKQSVSELTRKHALTQFRAASSHTGYLTAQADTAADVGEYQVTIEHIATAHKIASSRFDSSNEALELSGTFSVSEMEIEVTEDMTLRDVRDAVNNADAGVTATVIDNRLVLTREETGATQLAFDEPEQILMDLGLLTTEGEFQHELVAAKDAVFTVDGLEITRSSNQVDDVIAGVTMDLRNQSSETITLTVNYDTQSALNKVQSFVDKYNRALEHMSKEAGEGGNLRGDTILHMAMQQMRSIAGGTAESLSINRLQQIGIDSSVSGQLTIDREKFTEVASADPEAVSTLFNDEEQGFAVRLEQYAANTVSRDGLIARRTASLEAKIKDMNSRIDAMEDRLRLREENLVRQFTELEVAMSRLQNQSAWLSMQMSQWAKPQD